MIKHFFIFIFLISNVLVGQNIYTFAGNGTAGFSGDGTFASGAQLNFPISVAIDASGNLYIADALNNRIRKVDATGIISTIAGTGLAGYNGDGIAATAATLNYPVSIVIDASGNLYISDHFNHRIRKINTSGIISTIAGTGIPGYGGDGAAATSAKIHSPGGVCLDASGNVYFADYANFRIRKINTSGIISNYAGSGVVGYNGDGGPALNSQINYVGGITFDSFGNLFIADWWNHAIRKVNNSGIISTFAGTGTAGYIGDGGAANNSQLNYPNDIAFDATGNLYITDENNNKVRKVSTSGIISTIAGTGVAGLNGDGGPALAAELNYPIGITIDGSDNIFIAERGNNKIREICIGSCLANVNALSDNTSRIFIYPNPNNGRFTVELPEEAEVSVINILGETLHKEHAMKGKNSFNMQQFANGVYHIEIRNASEKAVFKIIKQ